MKFLAIGLVLVMTSMTAHAKSIQNVDFAETMTVGETALTLNGVGLRTVQRFGLTIKVYVAGLYLEKASSNVEEILKSETPKVVKLVFLRGVDKAQIQNAWKEGVSNNCVPKECQEAKEKLKELNKLMVDSKNKGTMTFEFYPDKVNVAVEGRSKSSGSVTSAIFSKTMLSVFLGPNPPTRELKNGLLGQAK